MEQITCMRLIKNRKEQSHRTSQSFSLLSMNFKPLSNSAFISQTWATEWTDQASSGVRASPFTREFVVLKQEEAMNVLISN